MCISLEHFVMPSLNILVVTVLAIQGNAKSLVVAGREIGLEVNADKTKSMDKSRD
jgi:hypothetical protein